VKSADSCKAENAAASSIVERLERFRECRFSGEDFKPPAASYDRRQNRPDRQD
jgi:hypothetical protein